MKDKPRAASKEAFFYEKRRSKQRTKPSDVGSPVASDATDTRPGDTAAVQEDPQEDDVEIRRSDGHRIEFSTFLEFDDLSRYFADDASMWAGAHVSSQGQVNAIPFVRLREGTDLRIPPPHYLRVDDHHNIHRHAPGYRRDSAQGLVALLDVGLDDVSSNGDKNLNVVTSDAVLQAIVDCYALNAPLLLWVYRLGPLIVIDTDERQAAMSTPSSHHEKALFAKFLYRMSDYVTTVGAGESVVRDPADAPAPSRGAAATAPAAPTTTSLVRSNDGDVPRLGTIATASIDGSNKWESSQAFTNVLKWCLPGNLNILLGVDRPIFATRQRNVFPVVLADGKAESTEFSIPPRAALRCWVSSLLSASSTVDVCSVVKDCVSGYHSVNAHELLRQSGCDQGRAAMNFAAIVLRWLQSQCVEQGARYLVARRATGHVLDVQRADNFVACNRSNQSSFQNDAFVRQVRRENCWALMALKTANMLCEGAAGSGSRLDAALELLTAASRWFIHAAVNCHVSQLQGLRHGPFDAAFARRCATEYASHVHALDAVMNRFTAVVSGQGPRETAARWCSELSRSFIDLLNLLQDTRRDMPSFTTLDALNEEAAGIAAASDSLWVNAVKQSRVWVASVAKLSLLCSVGAIVSIGSNTASSDVNIGVRIATSAICVAEEALESLRESTAAETNTSSSNGDPTLALSTPLWDADAADAIKAITAATREHCVDLLTFCLGSRRNERCVAVQDAVMEIAAKWPHPNRCAKTRPFWQLLSECTVSSCDVATVGYRCLSALTFCGSAPRVALKCARCHLFIGHALRILSRHTKALDSLAIALDMLKAIAISDSDDGSAKPYPIVNESDESAKQLRVAVQLELGLLHRDRARMEHATTPNDVSEAAIRAWDKAINCLREECSTAPEQSASCRTMLGAFMLEMIDKCAQPAPTLTPSPTPRPSVWYSDLLEKLAQTEQLLNLEPLTTLRLKLLTKALIDCVYTGTMQGATVATVLATRQHWASVGWAAICRTARGRKSQGDEVVHLTAVTTCADAAFTLLDMAYPKAAATATKLQFMTAMCEWNLTLEAESRAAVALPSRRRLLVELLDTFLDADVDKRDPTNWKLLLTFLLTLTKKVGTAGPTPLQDPLRNCVGVITGCGYGGGATVLNLNHESTCRNALMALRRAADPSAAPR